MAHYRKIYEQYYGVKIPKGYHVHHIDFNHANDDPLNLEALHPDVHAQKHGFLTNFIMAQARACDISANIIRGKPRSEKTKAAIGFRNSKKYQVTSPDGNYLIVINLHKFCLENHLCYTDMNRLAYTTRPSYKGWKCKKIDGCHKSVNS